MSEQDDALAQLRATRALDGLRWAHRTAYRQVMDDYDPETGHTQVWVGMSAYVILQDRMDRVFSCGRYAVDPEDPDAGRDLLLAGILQREFDTMPPIPPGTVVRADLNGSPGWQCGSWRWLLTSARFGHIDNIPWPQKRSTKQRVAQQPSPEDLTLFSLSEAGSGRAGEALDELVALAQESTKILILAHSVDRHTGVTELFLGRPRFNEGGGYAWHWRVNLRSLPPGGSGTGRVPGPPQPPGSGSDPVADAPVRLRPTSTEGTDQASGQR
ncbi:MAG: hypothetical protein ABR608_13530 [Pseudonocardiaceae bacterium]